MGAQNMSNLAMQRKNICQTIKKISVLFAVLMCAEYFCLDIMEVVIGFSMLKKAKNETQKRTRMTCQRKANMSKKRNMPKKQRKEKEDREEKGQNCTLPEKKVKTNFILFVSTLEKAFFAFQAFL